MLKSHLQILFFLLVTFSFACNREKVNLEGRWEVVKVSALERKVEKDSISQLMPHLSVGHKLDFTAGELTVNRKGADDSTYYGLASYKVENDGRTVMIDAGYYKPLKFKLRNTEDGQVELRYKRQEVKVLLKPYEEED